MTTVSSISTTFTITPQGYDTLQINWTLPTGQWNEQVLLRSSFGTPLSPIAGDGVTLLDEVLLPVYSSQFIDTGLKSGRFYYYTLLVFSTQLNEYITAGAAQGLVLTDYGFGTTFQSWMPDWYLEQDAQLVGPDEFGPLQQFLNLLGYEMDWVRSEVESIFLFSDVNAASGAMLPYIGANLGMAYEPDLGMTRSRVLIDNAVFLYKNRGTITGIESAASAFTGFGCTATLGPNIEIQLDDAAFDRSVGHWAKGNLTTTIKTVAAAPFNIVPPHTLYNPAPGFGIEQTTPQFLFSGYLPANNVNVAQIGSLNPGGAAYDAIFGALSLGVWYKLADAVNSTTIADSSGKGLVASVTGTPVFGSTAPMAGLPADTSVLFNGTPTTNPQYMNFVGTSSQLQAQTNFSLAGFFRTTASGSQILATLQIGHYEGAGHFGFLTAWEVYLNNGQLIIQDGSFNYCITSNAFNDGNYHYWNIVMGSPAAVGSIIITVDGVDQIVSTGGTWVPVAPDLLVSLTIGSSPAAVGPPAFNPTFGYVGNMAQFGFVNGALSASQRATLYVSTLFGSAAQGIFLTTCNTVTATTLGIPIPQQATPPTYVVSAYFMPDQQATPTLRSFFMQIDWYTKNGVFLSSTIGSAVTEISNQWVRPFVLGSPPAGAFYFGRTVKTTGPIGGDQHFMDGEQVETNVLVPSSWSPPRDIWLNLLPVRQNLVVNPTGRSATTVGWSITGGQLQSSATIGTPAGVVWPADTVSGFIITAEPSATPQIGASIFGGLILGAGYLGGGALLGAASIATTSNVVVTTTVSVNPQISYSLSIYMRAATQSRQIALSVAYFNGATLISVPPFTGTLSQPLVAGTAYNAIQVAALPFAVRLGQSFLINVGNSPMQLVQASAAAAAGATSISVEPFVATSNYVIGTNVAFSYITFFDQTGSFTRGSNINLVTPAGATTAVVTITVISPGSFEVHYLGGVLFEPLASLLPYFDANFLPSSDYLWEGTPNASISDYYPNLTAKLSRLVEVMPDYTPIGSTFSLITGANAFANVGENG